MIKDHLIFSCNGCKYAVMDETIGQIGCSEGYDLKIRHLKIENFYSLTRKCPMKNQERLPEVKMNFLFILKSEEHLNDLKTALLSLKTMKSAPEWIGINTDDVILDQECVDILADLGYPYNVIINKIGIPDIHKLDQFINKMKNGFTITHVVGNNFDPTKIAAAVKEAAYEKMISIAAIMEDKNDVLMDNVHNLLIHNNIFKVLRGSHPEPDQDGIFTFKSYVMKVQEQSPNMILEWSDL